MVAAYLHSLTATDSPKCVEAAWVTQILHTAFMGGNIGALARSRMH
jgi:hypothetical protein